MKRLFVGCRVRILWSYSWPELAGKEGTCLRKGVAAGGPTEGRIGWIVAPDGWPSEIAPDCSGIFCPMPEQLEPIIPEGHQIVSWEAMKGLWTPEGVPV